MRNLFWLVCLASVLLIMSVNAQKKAGDDLFTGLTVHTINIESSLPIDVFYDSLVYYKDLEDKNGGDGTYMKVNVTIDNTTIYDAAVKFKGNSSYTAPNSGVKKSMKIDLDKYIDGQDYDGLDKLNLNNCMGDPSMMREFLTYDLFNDMGYPSPRASHTMVYLNDSIWGLYSLVEIVEGTFLDTRFGENEGNSFKGDNSGHLVWEGTDPSFYYGDYELQNNDSANDWSDLIHLLDVINNTTDIEFEDSLETVLDVDVAINYWAICNLLVNLDSYLGSGHNYYIYHHQSSDQFVWIPWDANESFGGFTINGNFSTIEDIYEMPYDFLPSGMGSERPLYERMLVNTNLTKQYTDALYNLITNYVNSEIWNPRIDSIADVIRPYVYADPNYFYAYSDFDLNLDTVVQNEPGLKLFIEERVKYLNDELMAMGYPSAIKETVKANEIVQLFPNPASDVVNFKFKEQYLNAFEFIMYNNLGEIVIKKDFHKFSKDQSINVSELNSGIYSFTIENINSNMNQKGKLVLLR